MCHHSNTNHIYSRTCKMMPFQTFVAIAVIWITNPWMLQVINTYAIRFANRCKFITFSTLVSIFFSTYCLLYSFWKCECQLYDIQHDLSRMVSFYTINNPCHIH
eukprot:NODE_382_length_8372_cov_0.676538.p8 type:complete len:104 gc:universal NODE_382_length_8372_cov_0.676538:8110-7799(-)